MGIELFKSFGKAKAKTQITNYDVWGYSRVSTKDQLENNSLECQQDAIKECASDLKFNLTEMFGSTYESASDDLTRKEFMKLIDAVERAKKKPYAILIFKMSRFSRTGGEAIGLAQKLVDDLGVHLFEVSTGRDTTTETGKVEIYNNLLEARRENIVRLSQTVPGMIKHLKKGKWLGKVPRGYDHYGPKVKDVHRIRGTQEIKINSEGKILQQAWGWKLQGEKDCEILKRLTNLNIRITKQGLSEMWRNPFYCGVSTSSLLDGNVVNGNWDRIVSEQNFLFVQEILKGNRQGYKHNNSSPIRPLNGFIRCFICDQKMTGYEVKNKKTHYYKCQKCLGVSINTLTTPKAKGMGANDLFKELLDSYTVTPSLQEAFKTQLKLTYQTLNFESENEKDMAQEQLEKTQSEFKSLKRRKALGENIDEEIYLELIEEFEQKISGLAANIQNHPKKISNLDNYIDLSTDIAQNISKYWVSEGLDTKKRIQELVFPDGLTLDTKNRTYLTKKVNVIFGLKSYLASIVEEENKNGTRKNPVPSPLVSGSRLELPTFGL